MLFGFSAGHLQTVTANRLRHVFRKVCAPAAALLLGISTIPGASPGIDFSSARWRQHAAYLADPSLEGRALGSKGIAKAARYIEDQFRDLGLASAPELGVRLSFPANLDLEMEETSSRNRFSIGGPASSTSFTLRRDYQPLSFSGNGGLENRPLAFAGYAIADPQRNYDDFAGLDIRGKVVIAFRREPQERSESSRFQGLDFTRGAAFAAKAREISVRGGAALVLITNRLPEEAGDDLPPFASSSGPGQLPIPVVLVRAQSIAPFFTEQGLDLASLVRAIDQEEQPRSFEFPAGYRATLHVKLKGTSVKGVDVLGWRAGRTDEYVVVGAHYDHIGHGERFAMDPANRGKIHPGADDNASGVASLLEMARVIARGPVLRRGILFVAFAGEEHGLFGSTALRENLAAMPGRLTGMMNFDMVGRLRDNRLFIAGLDSVPALAPVTESAARKLGLSLERITDYSYSMSDHGTFLDAGVPAVLFFTGLHDEYHTALDTPDRLNAEGALRILAVAHETLLTMADGAESLEYIGGKDPAIQRHSREIVAPSNPFQQE